MSSPTIPVRKNTPLFPQPIGRMLRRLDRRVRAVLLMRGIGTTALVVSIVLATGMVIDFLWVLPQAGRWAIWGAALAAIVITFAISVVRSTFRRGNAFDLAAVAERGHGALEEQLTGAVGLLGGGGRSHGSPRLIAAVAERAAEHAGSVEPSRVVPWKKATARLAIGLAGLGLVTSPLYWWPDTYGRLARHFLFPWAGVERPGRLVLSVRPGDQALPVGADLSISASVRARLAIDAVPGEAWLHWSAAGQTARHRTAMPVSSGKDSDEKTPAKKSARDFEVTLPRLARTITYRVVSGSVSSPHYRVTVVEPPAVAAITASVEPPAYTKLPATVDREATRIEAFEGSRVTLDIESTSPVRSIEVNWPVEVVESAVESAGGETLSAILTESMREGSVAVLAARSGPFAVSLCDQLGIASRPDAPRRVLVRVDQPPAVMVRGPEGVTDIGPKDTLALGIAARDDIAVDSVELHYEVERRGSSAGSSETAHVAVSLKGMGSRSARGDAMLALAPLGLKRGDSLSYRVRVADNRPAPRGPNVVWSESQTLMIVAAAEPVWVRASRARSARLGGKLETLKKDVIADREETERLRREADIARRGEGEWDENRKRSLEEREAAARTIEDRLKLLARELAADPALGQLSRPVAQVGEVEAEGARAALEQARREADPTARHAGIERAGGRLASVSERLDELTHKFAVASREGAEISRLSALANRQEELAATAQPIGGDRAGADRAAAEQQAVERDLNNLVKQTPALRAVVIDAQVKEAERLAERARALADRQREESRRSVDLSTRGAEFKRLAELQRELEDDARKLAVQVDQPLGENGRSRLNSEGIRQALPPIERGDIEGAHERLEAAENELRRLTRDLEDVPRDPKAVAGRLFHRQHALNREIEEALRSVAGRKLTPEEQTAYGERLKPLGQRERAIAELAKTIVPPSGKEGQQRFPHEAAREAVARTGRLAEVLGSQNSSEIESRKNEARQALERLANELPDAWRRQEFTRQKFDEARRISNEVAEEINRHLRETNPRPDHLATSAGAAAELAERLKDAADKEAKVVAALEAMEPEARALPQRAAARRKAEALTAVLRELREPSKRERARDALADAQINAHVSMDRLQQKLNGRMPADELAQELADEERGILAAAGSKRSAPEGAGGGEALAAKQRAIAGALRNLVAPDAQAEQALAVGLAERAAEALAGPEPRAKPNPGGLAEVKEAAAAARALAEKLAGRSQGRAQEPPEARDPKAGKPAAEPVAETELALKPEHAAAATELARRERRIRERVQAMLGELATAQQEIRRDSVALSRELSEFRDRVAPLSDRAQYPAQAAVNHLGIHAPQALDQGVANLSQGQARAAREDERRAAELLDRGANLAMDLAAALRAERNEIVPSAASKPAEGASREGPAEAIGGAREQMRQAGRELEHARDPAQAAQSVPAARAAMLQAAGNLRAAAAAAGAAASSAFAGFDGDDDAGLAADALAQGDAGSARAGGSNPDPTGGPGGKADPDLTELKEMIRTKTGRKWGDLPGHLRNEILQMQAGRYRDDYARVIQLYFREIAGAGAADGAKKKD